MNDITVNMKLFGAFRQYGETVEFRVRAGSAAAMVKERLGHVLGDQAKALIGDSVLADEKAVLPDDFVFSDDARLSILPPVCGG